MEERSFGRTGLTVSALGLGCGMVGGLMTRGTEADQDRGIARAVGAGIRFFDTAPLYGDGTSETNLGRALRRLGNPDVVVATKVRLTGEPPFAREIEASLDASLRRLRRERVDVLQLHNSIGGAADGSVAPRVVLEDIVPAFERLRASGRIGCFGITAVGVAGDVEAVIDSGAVQTAQVPCNLLNPSASLAVAPGFPADDLAGRLGRASDAGLGTIVIRALAGGALSGTPYRHPNSMEHVDPMGTGPTYAADVDAARRFERLIEEGWVGSLTEAAMRFALYAPGASTALVGVATGEQLDAAIAAAEAGRLPRAAFTAIREIWESMAAGPSPT
jgi:L-galactose dehydrogenase/L-glyceraldehyde 3-phosphate reductase